MANSFIENVNALANATTLATGDIVEDTSIARDEAIVAAKNAKASATAADTSEELAHQWADKGHNNPVIGTVSGGNAEYSSYHWAVESSLTSAKNLVDDNVISHIYTWSSEKINAIDIGKSDIGHNHNSLYEPIFVKNSAFNQNFAGSGSATTVAKSDHTHSGVYEPVIAVKKTGFNLDIGVTSGTLSSGDHNHSSLYMPKVIEDTAYNRPFVVNTDAPLATEIPRGNHMHKAQGVSYDNTGNKIISSTTVQGALGQLDSNLSAFYVVERSKMTAGMTNQIQTIDVLTVNTPTKIATAMTVGANSRNALYSGGDIIINYPTNPVKLIEGWFASTVTLKCEANTKYSIVAMVNDVAINGAFKAQLGSDNNTASGDFALSIDGFISGLHNGDKISVAVINGTNTNDIVILAHTISWSGVPEGTIVASGMSVLHSEVTGRDAINQHPTTSIYDAGSGVALNAILDGKTSLITPVVADNMVSMDSTGDIVNSGISKAFVSNSMQKVATPTLDNIIIMDGFGQAKDGSLRIADLALKGGSTANKFLVMDATNAGEAVSKGQVDALASQYTSQVLFNSHLNATNPHNITTASIGAATNVHIHAISDTTGLQAALDTKYSKVTSPVTGNVAAFGAGGVLVDGGSVAPLNSPIFTGTPTAPTAPIGTNTTQLATTEFVVSNTVSKATISYMSKSGHNSQALVIDGKLYTASGTSGSYSYYTTGVYNSGANTKLGVMNGFSNVNIPSTATIVKVGGFMHAYAFALMSNGDLFTWGYSTNGQCGLGYIAVTIHPTLAATGVLDAYTHPSQGEFSVDFNRLFILKADGLYATGYNAQGQLGINSTVNVSTFTKCTGFTNTSSNYILQVFPIANHGSTWVLTSDKKLWVTGSNLQGSHGVGNTTQHNQFIDVTANWVTTGKTLESIKVTGGSRYYDGGDHGVQEVMVLLLKYIDGTSEVKTAGNNLWGSLGSGNTTDSSTPISPIGVPKDGSVIDIAGFGGSPLTVQALCANGDLWAWGHNGQGQVGDGTASMRDTPAKVTTGVTKLFSDGLTSYLYGYVGQSFIQKADGLYVCGYNDTSYYTGTGVTVAGSVLTYQKVLLPQDDNNVIDIGHYTTVANGRVMLALTLKGNVYVWGHNEQNGVHTDNTNNVPVPQLIQLPKRNN